MRASRMNRIGFVGALVLTAVAAGLRAQDAGVAAPATLEIIQFQPPVGWRAVDRPGQAVRMYVSPDATPQQRR